MMITIIDRISVYSESTSCYYVVYHKSLGWRFRVFCLMSVSIPSKSHYVFDKSHTLCFYFLVLIWFIRNISYRMSHSITVLVINLHCVLTQENLGGCFVYVGNSSAVWTRRSVFVVSKSRGKSDTFRPMT